MRGAGISLQNQLHLNLSGIHRVMGLKGICDVTMHKADDSLPLCIFKLGRPK